MHASKQLIVMRLPGSSGSFITIAMPLDPAYRLCHGGVLLRIGPLMSTIPMHNCIM
jgi:hypothetical protein